MRVHHLEVTAFGPFAQTQSIDLDGLGEAGLFLISGPTGSGKTSLLDAISFALFGSVPGTRVPKTLRSHHADPDVAPQVLLEVTLSGRRFRIRRSPSFTRPGRKTAVQASVTLDELVDGSWAHLTARLDEAGRILEDVLGMTAAQFHRVVVLPQGDFAAFLHASNDDRGELLRKLFDVDTFADVEAWLVEERKRLASAARDAGHDVERVRHSLVRVLSTLPAEDDEAAQAGGDGWSSLVGDELLAAVAQVDERVQQQATTALADADSTDIAHRTAERVLAEARTRAERHDRGLAAQSALVELESTADEQQARLERLDLAERAGRALAHQAALERAETHLGRTQAETDRAATSAGTGLAGLDNDGLAAWLRRLAEHDPTVDELLHEGRRWQESLQRLPQLATDVDGVTAGLAALTDERTRIAERLDAATVTREEARAAAADLDRLTGEARTLATLIATRTELDDLTTVTLPAAADLVRDARDRAQAARERHQDLIRQRLDDMAGELAEGLSPGDPCLVCGSPEHPEPAQRRSRIDDAVLESAEGAWRDELAAVDAAQASLAACQARTSQLTQALAGEPRESAALLRDAEILAREVEQVRSVAATLPETESLLTELAAERADLEAREDALTARLHRSSGLLETEQARAAASADAVARLLAEHAGCPCLHDLDATEADGGAEPEAGPAAEHARSEGAASEAAALARAVAARSTHDAAGARARALQESRRALAAAGALVTEATDARDRALAAERIDTVAAAAAAVLDAATREQIAQQAGGYAERRAVVTDVLADPDVAAALEQPRPDVDGLTLALEHARTRWQGAATLLGQVQHAAREVAEHRKQLAELVAESGPLTARLELVTELADLASGRGDDNADGISLTTYVLAVRLERIVALANERLSTMADGRYELEVDHGRSDKRSRGGLGLQVLDQWTGSHRPATTLSGGETFMVSLALALGTADAVREESGGIDLQTLFIDEGFGSLDDAALEQVLTVLDDLRSGGRSVGVISHVADMRQRIPAQLRVTKTASGSSVDVTLDVEDAA